MFAEIGQSAIEGASQVTGQAANLGESVFVVTLVLLLVAVYVFFVIVPNAQSQRRSAEKLTDAVALMSGHVVETHTHAMTAAESSSKVLEAMKVQSRIIEKLNDAGPKLPIGSELGEIRGALH